MIKHDIGRDRKIDCPVCECGCRRFHTVRRNSIWGCNCCGQTLVRVKE